jgi:hypothetical protein
MKSTLYWAVAYVWYKPGTYLTYLFSCTLPGIPGLHRAPGRIRSGRSADLFGFCDRKPAYSILGPAITPGADLVSMTAPARSLALSVSTAECKGLLLSRSVLVWNSRCGVSVQEARKEWRPPKKVLNSANIEGRDRRGLIQLPSSIGLHGARGLKVQIPS